MALLQCKGSSTEKCKKKQRKINDTENFKSKTQKGKNNRQRKKKGEFFTKVL